MEELFMGAVNFLFLLTLTSFFARQYKITFSRALPFSCSVLLVLLLILSMFNILNIIDYISFAFVAFFFIDTLIKRKFGNIRVFEILLFLIIISLLYFLCRHHNICHSDELRYWGLETKTIYYENGFSPKGMDPGYLYGNYHPGLVLFMWWFCHFSPFLLSEGLMFAGYWVLFSIPIISVLGEKITRKNFAIYLLTVIALIILVPTIVNETNYLFISAELPMASFFALLLFEMFQDEKKPFRIPYCASIVVVLSLLKSTGLIWALSCLAIGFIRNRNIKETFIPCLSGVGISVLWKVYCLCMSRTSYYASQVEDVFREMEWSGKKTLIEDFIGYTKSFFHTYMEQPLNISEKGLLNLSAVGYFIAIVVILFLFIWLRIINRRDGILLITSYIAIQFIFSIVLIIMCTFIFRENWYFEPECMINTLSRYGTVIYIGLLLLLSFFVCRLSETGLKRKGIVAGSFFVLLVLCSNYQTIRSGFFDNKGLSDYVAIRTSEVNERYSDVFQNRKSGESAIIIENEDDAWIEDRYLFVQYCGVPMKIVIEKSTEEALKEKIKEMKEEYGIESIYTYGF